MKLSDAEQVYWVEQAGCRLNGWLDRPIHELTRDTWGRPHIDSTVSVGIYVVVNADDDVVYVGKVARRDGTTIADRFRDHHAWNEDWNRVWVLPLLDDVDADGVFALEGAMIRYFRPHDNHAGLPVAPRRT